MATNVVWFDSDEVGAPTLNNAAGSLDAVLYACLVTGFQAKALTSLVVAAGVATATVAGGHGYTGGPGKCLLLAGASGSGAGVINARQEITVTGAATFTFPAPGVPDGAVAGAVTAKRAPLGWSRALTGGNVSIYTRNDVQASAMALRIDDSAANPSYARVLMVEGYSALDTYTGPAPTAAQLAGGGYWPKGANTAVAKPWVLVGDGRTFYLLTDGVNYPAASYMLPNGIAAFGDIRQYRAGDAYRCLLSYGVAAADMTAGVAVTAPLGSAPAAGVVVPRASSGVGAPVYVQGLSVGSSGRMGSAGPAFPSPVDNGLVIAAPLFLAEGNAAFGNPVRGELRGLGAPLGAFTSAAVAASVHKLVLTTVTGSAHRWLLLGFQQNGGYGLAAVDLDSWD